MDDFVISNLNESRNEWCARLVSIFTPLVIEGIRSIFNEAWKLCNEADDVGKYLMTFQNLLSRIPKWNENIITDERKRIEERSGCNYLEDLITCVHIIQLKVLTCVRVGNKQKKIDISIPKLDAFIHKIYIHVARKLYTNVYLFEKKISPLVAQKNNRELEIIVQECILVAIRESIPTEQIIRAYLDESVEQEQEVVIENIEEPVIESNESKELGQSIEIKETKETQETETKDSFNESTEVTPVIGRLKFNDYDSVLDMENNKEELVNAPKSIERLEEISVERALQRRLEEEEEELEDKIKISNDSIDLGELDIMNLDGTPLSSKEREDDDHISLDDLMKTF
jgi:hypothetical protein